MASHDDLEEYDFGGDLGGNCARISGKKRSLGDLDDDDEDDIFGSKKANLKVGETAAPGVATGTILSLRSRLKNSEEEKSRYQMQLEDAKSEIHKLREQLDKAKKKEAAFIVTFAEREREIADLKSAVRDMRSQLIKPASVLLDPAIHEEFTRLKNLVEEKDKKVQELQDNIAAVTFTVQSKNGKMLMAKCKTLQEENEELGNKANEGKTHELSMKLALQRSQNARLRNHFQGLFEQMERLTGDVDRSNALVVILQEKLQAKDGEIQRLKKHEQQPPDSISEKQNAIVSDVNNDDET